MDHDPRLYSDILAMVRYAAMRVLDCMGSPTFLYDPPIEDPSLNSSVNPLVQSVSVPIGPERPF